MTSVYVYVMETMADWELGYVMAELHSKRYFRKDAPEIEVRTVGIRRMRCNPWADLLFCQITRLMR